MPKSTDDQIAAAFTTWAKAKGKTKPDAADTVMFMAMVLGQSDEKCTHKELLALLRRRKLIPG